MESIGKYTPQREFTTLGGGQSEWTVARTDDGSEFFVKRYLQPVLPDPNLGLTEPTMRRLHDRVDYFRARQMSVIGRLDEEQFRRHVVGAKDFFEHERRFYKVTPFVIEVSALPLVKQPAKDVEAVLLGSVTAVEYLHQRGIVHGDIKPENIMLSRGADGRLETHLIDLDEGYVAGYAPSREDIVGTIGYYSPELGDYVSGRVEGAALTTASDMFSLGLTLVEMLTGRVPGFDRDRYRTVAHALGNGETPNLLACGEVLGDLMASLLVLDPKARPSAAEMLDRIGDLDLELLLEGAFDATDAPDLITAGPNGGTMDALSDEPDAIRVTGGDTATENTANENADDADDDGSGLIINLGRPTDRGNS